MKHPKRTKNEMMRDLSVKGVTGMVLAFMLSWMLPLYGDLHDLSDEGLLEKMGLAGVQGEELVEGIERVIGDTSLENAVRECGMIYAERYPDDAYVDELVDSIDLHTQRGSELGSITGRYPAVGALVAIGKPASVPLMDALLHARSYNRRITLSKSLYHIEGKHELKRLLDMHLLGDLTEWQRLVLERENENEISTTRN